MADSPLNVIPEDAEGCCGALRRALRKDAAMAEWKCPKCGLEWRPRMVDGVRLWECWPIFAVWRGGRVST